MLKVRNIRAEKASIYNITLIRRILLVNYCFNPADWQRVSQNYEPTGLLINYRLILTRRTARQCVTGLFISEKDALPCGSTGYCIFCSEQSILFTNSETGSGSLRYGYQYLISGIGLRYPLKIKIFTQQILYGNA